MTNTERIQANNASLRECIETAESLPDAGGGTVAEPVIEQLEITENGIYTAPDGIDGYSPVTVNVPTGGGNVGGLTQYAKFTVIAENKNQLSITNPLGGIAKKVSVRCPAGSAPESTNAMLQKYIIDGDVGIGAMKYIHATNGNITYSGASMLDEGSTMSNAKFAISDGEIQLRGYGSTNGIWDTTIEYEVEIWQ